MLNRTSIIRTQITPPHSAQLRQPRWWQVEEREAESPVARVRERSALLPALQAGAENRTPPNGEGGLAAAEEVEDPEAMEEAVVVARIPTIGGIILASPLRLRRLLIRSKDSLTMSRGPRQPNSRL